MLALAGALALGASTPLAPHVNYCSSWSATAGEADVLLKGVDLDGDALAAKVLALPAGGVASQRSQVYATHGYAPKAGAAVTAGDAIADNAMLWLNPVQAGAETCGKASASPCRLTYAVNDGTSDSKPGFVTFYPEGDVAGVASDFSASAEGWTVTGNGGAASATPAWEPSTRGALSYYVHAKDENIAGQAQAQQAQREGAVESCDGTYGCSDTQQWYFSAPSRFLGFQGNHYGGSLSFLLMSSSGDFAANNLNDGGAADLVVLECASCGTTLSPGIRLVARMDNSGGGADWQSFDGKAKQFTIPLNEASWLKDPKSTLAAWAPPTQCEMLQVLSHLSAVKILGDHTKWHESVSLDSPQFVATCSAQVPLFCTCSTTNPEEVALGCSATDTLSAGEVILGPNTLRQDTVMDA